MTDRHMNRNQVHTGRGTSGRKKQPQRPVNRARKLKVLKMRIILVCAAAVALVFWYCMVAASYSDVFLPHTTVNGLDVSGLTEEEAEKHLKRSVEDYTLALSFRGGSTASISGTDISLTYVSSGEVSELLQNQNRLTWLARKFGKTVEDTVATSFRIDETRLRTKLSSIPAYANGTAPVDAQIALMSDGTFQIEPEEEGDEVNESAAFRRIVAAINSGVRQLNLDSYKDTYETPDVRSDDADLVSHLEELNAFSQRTFTVNCKDGQTETVGPEELSSWVTHDEEQNTWTIDEDHVYSCVYAFIQKIAARDDDAHTTMEVQTTSLGAVTEPCREYGYKIDIGDNAKALYTAMSENSSDPVNIVNSLNENPADLTQTYLEIDVTNQVLYFYKDGKLFYRTKVVTGLESDPERRTPSGVFDLQGKDEDRVLGTLTAVDPNARYESHVDYWMPFYYSYGMHDASWRDINAFGGDIYLEHGSHGCVNLSSSSAKIIFNNVEVSTPVVVVRSGDQAEEGTEVGNTRWNPPEGGLHSSDSSE